ncbi:MAG TPA: ATP-binding protein [Candidatus Limnocylindrales bacterium]
MLAFGILLVAAAAWAWAGLSGASSGIGVVVGLAVLAVVVVALVLIVRWVRGLAEPVDDLVAAAGRVEAGDFDVQVLERGPREARTLARAFNRMSAQLATTERERRGFLADLTHELRTPLAVVRGNAEAIADGVYPADSAHLAPIMDATRTLERLVDDLRTVAQAEAGDLALRREAFDVGPLLLDAVAGFASEAAEHGVQLTAHVPEELPIVEADPVRIAQVVGNLLVNALRSTPAGGGVVAAAAPGPGADSIPAAAADGVVITVRDSGPGFPPDLLTHAFDRFAKGPDSPGAGLGLAIARDLVVAHGGTIEARNLPAGGAEVVVRLPTPSGTDRSP